MDEQVVVATPPAGGQANAGEGSADEMVQYVIYSGEGDQPIGLDELRDALTKLTGQPIAFQESAKDAQPALSQDTDLGFRLNAERMVGEVSFVDDSIVENKHLIGSKSTPKSSVTSNKLPTEGNSQVSELLKRQTQIPSQITIETEYGPITLDTSKLTPGQLDGTEQITVNLLTTDPNGDSSKEITETRGLKLPPGLLAPKGKAGLGDGIADDVSSMQGSDFNSVLQQLTDLCSEQNPLPVQDTEKALLKDAEGLEEFMNMKIPAEQAQKQSSLIEMDRLESFLKSKFGDTAKIQIQSGGVVVEHPKAPSMSVKPAICCAAHSELKNQETRRRMLPIPLDVTKCPECHRDCLNRKNLRLHIQRFHVQDFRHQCQTRARVIPPPPEDIITDIPILVESTENLAAIGEKSAPKTYKCSICETQLDTQKDYFSHMECHGQRNVCCTQCGMKYSKVGQLKNHVIVVHGGMEQFQCKHCMESFTSDMAWRAHEREHETPNQGVIQCLKCCSLVPQAKFRHHMASLHRVIHKPKQDCVFCGSRFKTPEYLAAHIHQYHNFEKNPHLCALCYKAFPSSEERDGHILRKHKDDEIMDAEIEFSWEPRDCYKRQCARCGKMFTNYAKLKAHYDKHGSETNACVLCGVEFHWIVNLDLHYKREHTTTDVVKFGIDTPTMNLLRLEDGSFDLAPKIGRQFSSKYDLADLDPVEELSAGQEVVTVESTPFECEQRPTGPTQVRPAIRPKANGPKSPRMLTPKPARTSIPIQNMKTHCSASRPEALQKGSDDVCMSEFKKVLGKTDFDYRQFLPVVDESTDLATVKAPRHNDIVMGRPATVINLARVWSRREKGLFYMGNEAEKFRRAAATIPKKRIGDQWVEMPLFVDELSGKLVTVEGMAELWRSRAQIFLNVLGRGQVINDFLPVYEVGGSTKVNKNDGKGKEASSEGTCTSTEAVSSAPGEKRGPSKLEVQSTSTCEVVQAEDDAKEAEDNTKEAEDNTKEAEDTTKEADDKPLEEVGEDESQWFTKKVVMRDADSVMRDPEDKKKKRVKRAPEKDIIPDIVQGIKKARKEMKARGNKTPAGKVVPEKRRSTGIKGKKGTPPGFNPYRDNPYSIRERLVLTDICDIIGDAKKIIVQMEADRSPERKHWKKQTARKSIVRPRPVTGDSSSNRDSDRATKAGQTQKRDPKKNQEDNKQSTRAQRKMDDQDMVDGPPVKRTRREKADDDKEPSDKGAGSKVSKSNTTTKTESKNVQKRGSKTDSSPAAKKSKTETAKTKSIVSPREATLSNKTVKTVPEPKSSKQSKPTETDKTNKTNSKGPKVRQETPEKKQRGRPSKKLEDRRKPGTKGSPKGDGEDVTTEEGSPHKQIVRDNASDETEADREVDNELGNDYMDPDMPTLELEITSQEYIVPSDSPLPSTSSTSDDISRETKRAMQFLPADFDLEEASLETRRKTMKMVLYEEEAASVTLVGVASSPAKKQEAAAGDAWDVLVGTPTKTLSKQS